MEAGVSVIVRAYDAEAPYIKSFINHYIKIGCKAFHIVVPQGNQFQRLAEQCEGLSNVKIYANNANAKLKGSQNIPLQYVNTSHLISVDVDEYLNIDDINILTNFDYVRLNWVIVPWCGVEHLDHIPGFIDKQCKYLVRTSICVSLDEHDCETNINVTPYLVEGALLHYVYRSFADLFLKCTLSNYGDYQAKNVISDRFTKPTIENLPHKFKMAAIYQRLANASSTRFLNLVKIDTQVEDDLLAVVSVNNDIKEFKLAYLQYHSRIDLSSFLKKLVSHPNYKKYKRIPHHVLADIADKTLVESLTLNNLEVLKKFFKFINWPK